MGLVLAVYHKPTRVKLGTKTGPTFQYSLFKGFYITKKYHINIYYTTFKLFIHFGYIDIKIDNQAFNLLNSDMFCRKQTISVDFSVLNVSKYEGIILYLYFFAEICFVQIFLEILVTYKFLQVPSFSRVLRCAHILRYGLQQGRTKGIEYERPVAL